MAHLRAPKQRALTKSEDLASFETWRQNLVYSLSLEPLFAPYIQHAARWEKRGRNNPTRGFRNDGHGADNPLTAAQKVNNLELMLGQIASYAPIINRNYIVKNSTSLDSVWQAIRLHYGFQSTGAHFLDFATIKLEPDET